MDTLTDTELSTTNYKSKIIAVVIILPLLSLLVLMLRLVSRRLKHVKLYYDDYLATTAWLFAVGEIAMLAEATRFAGWGYYLPLLTVEQLIAYEKVSFAFAIVHSTALLLGKASALVLLYRIFVTRKFRVAVRILSTVLLLWWLASLIGLLAVCVPIETYWNPFVGGHCGNWYIFNLVIPIPWIVTDFAILILPIPVIWTLQLPRSEKISIGAVFLTGASTCIANSYRYSTLFSIYNGDHNNLENVAVRLDWTVIETNVTIICACLITVKPALQRALPEKLVASARSGWSRILHKASQSDLNQQESEATTNSVHE